MSLFTTIYGSLLINPRLSHVILTCKFCDCVNRYLDIPIHLSFIDPFMNHLNVLSISDV